MHAYRVKVKSNKQTFLLGGNGVLKNIRSYAPSAILMLRVDEHGERVRLGILRADDARTAEDFGFLEAGEGYALSISKVVGVYAVCDAQQDTYIDCTVIAEKG